MSYKETVSVVVDIHEPTEIIKEVREHEEVEDFTIESLDSADLVIRGIGFERKTPEDYASSLVGESERTLSNQLEKMKEAYGISYVLIEGDIEDFNNLSHTRIKPQSLRGSVASTTARHEIPVMFCSDMHKLVDIAVRLARKHNEEPVSNPLPTGSVTGKDEPFTKKAYGQLDGVGAKTAEALYEEYDSIEQLLNVTKGELRGIDGVGAERADSILKQLRGK